jgi:hypothetical protein
MSLCSPVLFAQIDIPAVQASHQVGSTGPDHKAAATGGVLLGNEFGGHSGDFAEYRLSLAEALKPAVIKVRYARQLQGGGQLIARIDGNVVGALEFSSTGGWGDRAEEFAASTLIVPEIAAGEHTLRLQVEPDLPALQVAPEPDRVLDVVGNRTDKNCAGHGNNVAIYTGSPSKFFYATVDLTDVFSAVDGRTLLWRPDQIVVDGSEKGINPALNVNLDLISVGPSQTPPPVAVAQAQPDVIDQRQVCVTDKDVVISRITLQNTTDHAITHRITVDGDCRGSADWRSGPGGRKESRPAPDGVLLIDHNVFPEFLSDGLAIAVGSLLKPTSTDVQTPGKYSLNYEIVLTPHQRLVNTFACAIAPSASVATRNLRAALDDTDPVERNTDAWRDFFDHQIPYFECSNPSLNELYYFRWFLLKFSTAGGDLGLFKYPVTMEGREAFQTYCCYSAPFMAFDLNWADDPEVGFGQIANMVGVAYPDGRFPWYCSPRTNHVKLDHPSATGQSLLPWTAWRHYEIHGDKNLVAKLYPTMKRNVDWWISDRDPKGCGLFEIDHQLETGMDDLHRRWTGPKPRRYQAIDATCYTILNLQAVAHMAQLLGQAEDAVYYQAYADKSIHALNMMCWDPKLQRYRDRNPDTGELSDYNSITIFYPFFAGIAGKEQLPMIDRYLLNPAEYYLPFPVPALSRADPEFDPVHRYWAGLTWPATNSHVIEGLISTCKRLDRSRLADAAKLFWQIIDLQLRPRADFYEHYNPLTGQPLSTFRDYMHSWWIDLYIRHIVGLTPQDDGSVAIDPLPMGLQWFELKGAMIRGHKFDVSFNKPAPGLKVEVDGKAVIENPTFVPGGAPIRITGAAMGTRQ